MTRRSPRTKGLTDSIREMVKSRAVVHEGVYLIGFDWKPVYLALGPPGRHRERLLEHQSDRCYRALLYVGPEYERGKRRVHVLLLGGGGFYSLNVNRARRSATWCAPRQEVYRDLETPWPHT